MKHLFTTLMVMCAFILVGAPLSKAAVFNSSTNPTINDEVKDDLFTNGSSVVVNAPIFGDLFTTGGTISINKPVQKSLYAVGSSVTIDEGAGYNAWVAAQTVIIRGTIGHDVWVIGQTVTLDPSTKINGQLRISAETITLAGSIDGETEIYGGTVTSSANFGNNVTITTETLKFNEGKIAGNLLYKTPAEISDFGTLTVVGSKTHQQITYFNGFNSKARTALYAALSMLVTGAVFLFFFRRKVEGVVTLVTTNWASMLGTGVVVLLLVPVVCLLLLVTGVAIPLALLTLATYGILLYVSGIFAYVIFGVGLFKVLKQKYQSLWVPFVTALIVMGLIQLTPGLNRFVFALFFVGVFIPTLGGLVRWYQKEVMNG